MSGGLPIRCPRCDGKTRSQSVRQVKGQAANTGSSCQYRKCKACGHTFKAIIEWTVAGSEDTLGMR